MFGTVRVYPLANATRHWSTAGMASTSSSFSSSAFPPQSCQRCSLRLRAHVLLRLRYVSAPLRLCVSASPQLCGFVSLRLRDSAAPRLRLSMSPNLSISVSQSQRLRVPASPRSSVSAFQRLRVSASQRLRVLRTSAFSASLRVDVLPEKWAMWRPRRNERKTKQNKTKQEKTRQDKTRQNNTRGIEVVWSCREWYHSCSHTANQCPSIVRTIRTSNRCRFSPFPLHWSQQRPANDVSETKIAISLSSLPHALPSSLPLASHYQNMHAHT